MPVNLNQPLDDKIISNQEQHFLKNLQANILKSHGREHVILLFLAIKNTVHARRFLNQYPVSDAYTQLSEAKTFKESNVPGSIIRLVFLSKSGLDVLGHGDKFNAFAAFSGGMANDISVLDNGNTASWQPQLKLPVHAVLLLAYHDELALARVVGKMVENFDADDSPFEILLVQEGRAYKNADGEGIEHFGYVDGRSQPLMVTSSIEAENQHSGIDQYDPSAPLSQFILSDPLNPTGFGSFFVFRKLEQNVAGFKQTEKDLAHTLNLTGSDEERAGAMVVGRFEDGTPLPLSDKEAGVPVPNNFNYDHDNEGSKCPFHAHIRKSNPRGSSPGGLAFDKSVQMARRGITYGSRIQDPDSKEFIDKPNDGVGLLFMSYQASIENQFQFMQSQWVNNENFPHANTGIDPVIGQNGQQAQNWLPHYGSSSGQKAALFHGFVTLKGGEYLFTPSISGLKNL